MGGHGQLVQTLLLRAFWEALILYHVESVVILITLAGGSTLRFGHYSQPQSCDELHMDESIDHLQ